MSFASVNLMTVAEFESLPPDDSVYRELILGELRERKTTRRNRTHARIECQVAHLLKTWLDEHPELDVEVYSGEVGCILQRDPDTSVGVDVLVASLELEQRGEENGTKMLDGTPLLAIEVVSPHDTQIEFEQKIELYLSTGVPLVWVITPKFETIDVYRPDAEPERFNINQELTGEPHLPSLKLPVSRVFRRRNG